MTEPTLNDTQAGFIPADGQAFYFTSKPPAKPETRNGWLLPLLGSFLLIPLLMLGFGVSQQQQTPIAPTPSTTPSPPDTPTPSSAPSASVPSTEAVAQPQPTESLVPAAASVSLPDQPALVVASVRCPGVIANFRSAPSLHSLVQDVIPDESLIEMTNRQVAQDGVTWQEVRYRGRMGWVASNFLGASNHVQP